VIRGDRRSARRAGAAAAFAAALAALPVAAQTSSSTSFRLSHQTLDAAGGGSSSDSFRVVDCLAPDLQAGGRSASSSFVLLAACAAGLSVDLADLEITKTVDDPLPATGDVVTFTFEVFNHGPAPAVGVVVDDTLPAGLTLVSTTGCAEDPAGSPICSLGSIAAQSAAVFTLDAVVAAEDPATIVNFATVSAETADPNGADDSASATLSVHPVGIPTLGGAGIATLVLLLAAFALSSMRRRRPRSL
jgi:uncharacterized repeat protein (TIGR01451 family)